VSSDPERPIQPQVVHGPHHRTPRRLIAMGMRPERVLALVIAAVLIISMTSYDVAGIRNMQRNPITGVDYVPVVEYVSARRLPGQKVLVALPPPAYLAFDSTDNLIFLSSPITRKRAERYTRLTKDGNYVDYWTGVDSIVDTAGLCRLIQSTPDLLILVDTPRLIADWAFKGSMATVINGMTYVRYSAPGGGMVRGVSPVASRTVRAEQLCAMALTGNLDENATDSDGTGTTDSETEPDVAEPTAVT